MCVAWDSFTTTDLSILEKAEDDITALHSVICFVG
jgi:hypothetical protein